MDLIKTDPGLIQTNPEPIVYRCRKCRRIVASKSNIINHNRPKTGNIATSNNKMQQQSFNESTSNSDEDEYGRLNDEKLIDKLKMNSINSEQSASETAAGADQDPCKKIYFIEPLAWMDGIQRQTQGKLNCPKCKNKLGNFSWIMGCKCECGEQMSPAFYLVPSKVDLCHSVQNVQTTV